jgi:hypothetical protein
MKRIKGLIAKIQREKTMAATESDSDNAELLLQQLTLGASLDSVADVPHSGNATSANIPGMRTLDLTSARRYTPLTNTPSPRSQDSSPRSGLQSKLVILNKDGILTPRDSLEKNTIKIGNCVLLMDSSQDRGSPRTCAGKYVCFHTIDLFVNSPCGKSSVWRTFSDQSSLAIAACIKSLGGSLSQCFSGHFAKHSDNVVLDTRPDLMEETSSEILREMLLYLIKEPTGVNIGRAGIDNDFESSASEHDAGSTARSSSSTSCATDSSPNITPRTPTSDRSSPREWLRLDSPVGSRRIRSANGSPRKNGTEKSQRIPVTTVLSRTRIDSTSSADAYYRTTAGDSKEKKKKEKKDIAENAN